MGMGKPGKASCMSPITRAGSRPTIRPRVVAMAITPKPIDGFRSSLEWRWAWTFTHEFKWDWEYEPCRLRYYIPDFKIKFKKTPIYVEVKPATEYDIHTFQPKLERAKSKLPILLMGKNILRPSINGKSFQCLGKIFLPDKKMWHGSLAGACNNCLKVTPLIENTGCFDCGSENVSECQAAYWMFQKSRVPLEHKGYSIDYWINEHFKELESRE